MPKGHQPSTKLAIPKPFVDSLRRQEWTLEQIYKDFIIPLAMVLRFFDLRIRKHELERSIVKLERHLDFNLLDLALSSPHRVVDRVGPSSMEPV